jgi:hypothetical protein
MVATSPLVRRVLVAVSAVAAVALVLTGISTAARRPPRTLAAAKADHAQALARCAQLATAASRRSCRSAADRTYAADVRRLHASVPIPAGAITAPALEPAFSLQQPDYTVRCDPDTPVTYALTAPTGGTVAVDGGAPAGGTVAGAVPLRPGQAFSFAITRPGGTQDYHVRCVPPDFPATTTTGTPSSAIEGFVASPSLGIGPSPYVVLFDAAGVPIWWMHTPAPAVDATVTPDGHVAWEQVGAVAGFQDDPSAAYELHALDGSLAGTVRVPDGVTDLHEFQVDAAGDYDLLSYRQLPGIDLTALGGPANATVMDCVAEIVAPDGSIVWSWDAFDHLGVQYALNGDVSKAPAAVSLPDSTPVYDIYHCNSMQATPTSVLLSFRHLDAVYLVDRATGDIDWKLGGAPTAESLTIQGDTRLVPLDGQHDARLWPDGTVSVHDNATFAGGGPRVARYSIDAATRTATLVQQIVDPTLPNSTCCGSARLLPDGDWIVGWGSLSTIAEYSSQGAPVFSLTFGGGFSYRAVPVPLGTFDLDAVRAGMDTMAAAGASS